MFVPEYTITAKTLKNIALIEYGKAIIENTVILPKWEQNFKEQNDIDQIYANLQLEGFNADPDVIKKTYGGFLTSPAKEILQTQKATQTLSDYGNHKDINESDLKNINRIFSDQSSNQTNYRSQQLTNKVKPEEILAEIVELFDWLNGMDARDSHPIVASAIAKARLEAITPFDKFNTATTNILTEAILRTLNFSLKNFANISTYYSRGKRDYFDKVKSLNANSNDFTQWIEYFSQGYAVQVSFAQEKVKLLAKETKIAKVTGRINLTDRQEKIVEYLQDYGILQNKDFPKLFPSKSEDSVLRDLKALTDLGVIQKVGSTKSSRYELK